MYLASRFRHVNSASMREGVAAAVEAAGMASTITGLQVSAWTTVASPDSNLICWSAMIDHLADLDAANRTLGESTEFGDWLDAHDKFFDGRTEDGLVQVVHGTPDPARTVNVVMATQAVCAYGSLGSAMAAGVELAETATKITGIPTLFGALRTGLYGNVIWFAGTESLAELETTENALAADPSWLELVDQHGSLFQPGGETTWFQRLA